MSNRRSKYSIFTPRWLGDAAWEVVHCLFASSGESMGGFIAFGDLSVGLLILAIRACNYPFRGSLKSLRKLSAPLILIFYCVPFLAHIEPADASIVKCQKWHMKKPRNLVGAQLQKIRLETGVSQTELAAISQRKGWDISRNIIAKIESRSRCVSDFEAVLLAESLKVPVSALFPSQRIWLANRSHFVDVR